MLAQLQSLGFSDVTITVGDVDYPLHKIILCQLEFFRPLLMDNGNFHHDKHELEFANEDWENVLIFIYQRLYPDVFVKTFNKNELVELCILMDFLQGRKFADEIFEELYDSHTPNLCRLMHIKRYKHRALSMDFKTGINLVDYPDAFIYVFKDFHPSPFDPSEINIAKISDEHEKLLEFPWGERCDNATYSEMWDMLPLKHKRYLANQPVASYPCVFDWAFANGEDMDSLADLVRYGRLGDFFRKTALLEKQVDVAKFFTRNHGELQDNWKKWMNISEDAYQAYYLYHLMDNKDPSITAYVEDYMKKFLEYKICDVSENPHEQLLTKYNGRC